MLRAVSQMVTSSDAATRMMTVATAIHRRHAAQSSALVMGILAARALDDVVIPIARAVNAPKPMRSTRRTSRLLGGEVLPPSVEELHRLVGQRLRLHVSPPARHLSGDVPAMLSVGLAVRQSPQPPDDAADGPGREGGDGRARRRLVERAELVGEAGHRAADADAARLHAAAHVVDGAAHDDVAVDHRAPAADLDEALGVAVLLGEYALLV